MAQEFYRRLEGQLAELPSNHPDRSFLEAQLVLTLSYLQRRTPITETRTTEQLVEAERQALKGFFGREITVPTPPQALVDTARRVEAQGITIYALHFLPPVELKQKDTYPGWTVKPESWFWEQIKTGKVSKDAAKLSGQWMLVDHSPRPNYEEGKQMYENDPHGPLLAQLRRDGKISVPAWAKHVPQGSRFAISADELEAHVYPAIAKTLGVDPRQVGFPKEIEFNVLGNLHYPHLGEANTWEWFADIFEGDDRLIGGLSGYGGLADVYCSWSVRRDDSIGFRPVVRFPQKA